MSLLFKQKLPLQGFFDHLSRQHTIINLPKPDLPDPTVQKALCVPQFGIKSISAKN